jgi:hypothetical protein
MQTDSQIIKMLRAIPKSKATNMVAQAEEDLESFREVTNLDEDDDMIVKRQARENYTSGKSNGKNGRNSHVLHALLGGTILMMILTAAMYEVAISYVFYYFQSKFIALLSVLNCPFNCVWKVQPKYEIKWLVSLCLRRDYFAPKLFDFAASKSYWETLSLCLWVRMALPNHCFLKSSSTLVKQVSQVKFWN